MHMPADQFQIDGDMLAILRNAGTADYAVFETRGNNPKEASLSERGSFVIFPTLAEVTSLIPPIDWRQDPFKSRSWCAELHTLRFLDVLFSRYRQDGDTRALRYACDIVLNWVSSNPRSHSEVSEMAWLDKVAGDRAPFIGYLLRASVGENLLTEPESRTLFNAALDHIAFFLDETTYTSESNHGLFQDIGLVLLSSYLDFLPQAKQWRDIGIQRFAHTLARQVAQDEGVYLEHSPTYQWVIVDTLRRFCEMAKVADQQLLTTLSRLERASGWLVFPNGQTPPLGDSDMVLAPAWARTASLHARGMRLFRQAGIASVREEDSMLIAAAGYHTHAHKHADELGFCLSEKGELILVEAGKYGYDDAEPARKYAISSSAHNVLLVDKYPFSPLAYAPYGSALTRHGENCGWYALEGTNPLLHDQGVLHRRLFVYRPGEVLIIIDRVTSAERHLYTRLFHFGPAVVLEEEIGGSLAFQSGPITGRISDESVDVSAVTVGIRKGQRTPALSGWFYPRYRESTEIATVSFEADASDATFVTSITVNGGIKTVCVPEVHKDAAVICVEGKQSTPMWTVLIKSGSENVLDVSVT